MFYWDRGLFLLKTKLALDITRPQACGFASHAHADHIARHQLTLCTPATAALLQHRLGMRSVKTAEYQSEFDWGEETSLTFYPAGHCLGSAMLLVKDKSDGTSLLYTGDFKLGTSLTAEKAIVPRADILITESTFGHPNFRFPSRSETIRDFLSKIDDVLSQKKTPVVFAYSLGKSQEIVKILTDSGFRVQIHQAGFEICQIYEKFGISFGDYLCWNDASGVKNKNLTPWRNSSAKKTTQRKKLAKLMKKISVQNQSALFKREEKSFVRQNTSANTPINQTSDYFSDSLPQHPEPLSEIRAQERQKDSSKKLPEPGRVLILSPQRRDLSDIPNPVTFYISGWANDPTFKYRMNIDFPISLSDHADFDELLETVQLSGASKIFCTHGDNSFVDALNDRGFCARPLDGAWQERLF